MYIKHSIFILIVLIRFVVTQLEQTYSTKYDRIHFIENLQNENVLHGYLNCLLDEGSCTPEGQFLKDIIPEALATRCGKCTRFQKTVVKIASNYIIENFPARWDKLVQKYDPKDVHRVSFMAFLEEKDT